MKAALELQRLPKPDLVQRSAAWTRWGWPRLTWEVFAKYQPCAATQFPSLHVGCLVKAVRAASGGSGPVHR